jgi:hypothetical protein
MIDEAKIHAEMARRIRTILESPQGQQQRPLAEHLAFETLLPADECLKALESAEQESLNTLRSATHEAHMRLQ